LKQFREALACARYAAEEGFPRSVKGEVYYNVQTADFHGELSTADTFGAPQSRGIDVLVELILPRQVRLLTSGKDSK
jgi:hypothetical protein